MTPYWDRLDRYLLQLAPEVAGPPPGGRVGAALALLGERSDGDLEIVYTRRRDDLSNHPGQISFPGGRVDRGESIEEAAIREAHEEIGLRVDTAQPVGRLPAFYIPPSRYWLQIVVARWATPHELVAAESEVSEILRAPLSVLTQPRYWRAVRLSSTGWSWAWQLDDRHLLWGATAMVTATLLDALEPGWRGGRAPVDLGPDRVVQPWMAERETARASSPARLAGRPQRWVEDAAHAPWDGGPATGRLARVAALGAGAVADLVGDARDARVLVLIGGGGNGAAGLALAAHLTAAGRHVDAVTARPHVHPAVTATADDLGRRRRTFEGALPEADVVVDALVGGGLRGPLGGVPHDMLLELRRQFVPTVSLDVPSGLHPIHGLVGDTVTADLTIALGAARDGLFRTGLAPFVGDLYLVTDRDDTLVRLVRRPERTGWRE